MHGFLIFTLLGIASLDCRRHLLGAAPLFDGDGGTVTTVAAAAVASAPPPPPPLEPNDNDNDEHRHHHGLMGAPMAQRPMWFTQIS